MLKVFISQVMKDKTDEEILSERQKIIERIKNKVREDFEVIDTFYTDFSSDTKPLEYIARSIKDLAKADVAYFAEGWNTARGCRIEHECSIQYGIPILYERGVIYGD